MRFLIAIVVTLAFAISCAESSDTLAKYGVDTSLDAKEQLAALNEKLGTASAADKKEMLQAAYKLATSTNDQNLAIPYAVSMIKQGMEPRADMLLQVATAMGKGSNPSAANLLLQGLVDNHSDSQAAKTASSMLKQPIADKEAYIIAIAESVFVNPDKFGINTANAQKYVDVCEAYALAYPGEAKAPEYLYKASEIAVAIRTFPKALNIYDWLIDQYPDYTKTPNALFAKGYLLDEELEKRDLAKATFSTFIQKYPDHELADDAKFLLENIGKSGEEIIQIIEAAKKERESKGQ